MFITIPAARFINQNIEFPDAEVQKEFEAEMLKSQGKCEICGNQATDLMNMLMLWEDTESQQILKTIADNQDCVNMFILKNSASQS